MKKDKITPYLITFGIIGFILGISLIPIHNHAHHFHTEKELAFFKAHALLPPVDSSIIFPAASSCEGCHGKDAQGNANVAAKGQDVNVHDDWRATMMANSAKDPFWRAKISHEVLFNPSHQADIETKCTSCHAPQGHYTAILRGAEHYGIADLLADTIGLDGVSCSACHQMSDVQLGDLHSGELRYDTNRIVYGPYEFPFAQPMSNFVGFKPEYSPHINDAGICAGCHTLVTDVVDLNSEPTGETFVEQATYHEWLNSVYAEPKMGQTCQSCHIPRIDDSVRISNNYIFLEKRSPFGLHELVGGNSFMLKLMKEHRDTLGINATAEHFDKAIANTLKMLQKQTLDIELTTDTLTADTAFFSVALQNKAGHKFPSGYPSRRAVLEFLVIAETGDTLFQSGSFDSNYEVQHIDAQREPHYDIIRSTEEAQIYELVTGNVAGDFTTLLERSAISLKDNRLPPIGFTTTHAVYDTTRIEGNALNDPNFNKENNTEGSGKDIVHYHIPLDNYTGYATIVANVWYQSLPPRWLAPMLAEDTPEINKFREMYVNADQTPVFIGQDTLQNIYLESMSDATKDLNKTIPVVLYPNPTIDGTLHIELPEAIQLEKIELFDLKGQFIKESNKPTIDLPKAGLFVVKIWTNEGLVVRRVVR